MNATVAGQIGRGRAVPVLAGAKRPELRLIIGGKSGAAVVAPPSAPAVPARPGGAQRGGAQRAGGAERGGVQRGRIGQPRGTGQPRGRARTAGPAGDRAGPARRVGTERQPVRLTRRGRLVVTGAAAMLIGVSSLAAATAAKAASHEARPAVASQHVVKVTVRAGQTLWSVAQAADPDADPRAVIAQISQLNSLSGVGLMPGQALWVPKG